MDSKTSINGLEINGLEITTPAASLDDRQNRSPALPISGTLPPIDTEGLRQTFREIGRGFQAASGQMNQVVSLIIQMRTQHSQSSAFRLDGIAFYREGDDGCVQVGDYREDIEWFHGLLLLRYGSHSVSPLSLPKRGPRSFCLNELRIIAGNRRWKMYCGIK